MDNDELLTLEEALRRSLKHVSVPEGFAGRVQARIAAREEVRSLRAPRSRAVTNLFAGTQRRVAGWAAVAAMLALSAGTAELLHRRERQQAAEAQARVDYAMQLTTHALDEVEMGVNRSPAGRFAQLINEVPR